MGKFKGGDIVNAVHANRAALPDIVAKPMTESALRKMQPVGTVVTEYFPKGLRGVAAVSWVGNEKHNPGQPLGWSEGKSTDHVDCLVRHRQDAVEPGSDGWDTTELPDGRIYQVRHAAAAAWRALALAELDAREHGMIRVIRGKPRSADAQSADITTRIDVV